MGRVGHESTGKGKAHFEADGAIQGRFQKQLTFLRFGDTARRPQELVGLYENTEAGVAECVVITENGLLIEKGGVWERHAFSEINAAHAPPKAQGKLWQLLMVRSGPNGHFQSHVDRLQ
jgi:hypothetical protein